MSQKKIKAYGASGAFIGGKNLHEMAIERNSPKDDEVWIDILYCGVCRSDLHQVNNDWKNTIYPCVPGHEIIGRVKEIGNAVTKFKTGGIVGVGCMIDSCGACHSCKTGDEQYCEGPVGWTSACNGYMRPDDILFSEDESMMKNAELKFSFILVTIPDPFDVDPYITLLKRDGTLVTVGLIGEYKKGTDNNEAIMHRKSVPGSLIGSIAETQEVLEFCAKHNILPETEMIRMENINDAFEKLIKEEARFRYVIDMQSLKENNVE